MKMFKTPGNLVGSVLVLTLLAGAPVVATAAQLTGSLATGNTSVNLTSLGVEDWAIWGYAGSGTSTSLSPDASKSGGTAISSLTAINPSSLSLRGTGQFSTAFPATWNNGTPTASASGVYGGLQFFTTGHAINAGFSFTVPADMTPRTVKVFVTAHQCTGQLTATLSDGSATAYTNSSIPNNADNSPGVYTITYAAASAGKTLTVVWKETATTAVGYDNVSIYAVTLISPPVITKTFAGKTWALIAGYRAWPGATLAECDAGIKSLFTTRQNDTAATLGEVFIVARTNGVHYSNPNVWNLSVAGYLLEGYESNGVPRDIQGAIYTATNTWLQLGSAPIAPGYANSFSPTTAVLYNGTGTVAATYKYVLASSGITAPLTFSDDSGDFMLLGVTGGSQGSGDSFDVTFNSASDAIGIGLSDGAGAGYNVANYFSVRGNPTAITTISGGNKFGGGATHSGANYTGWVMVWGLVGSADATDTNVFKMTLGSTATWVGPNLDSIKGDDRGGLTLGSNVVVITGDTATIAASKSSGAAAYNYGAIQDYIASDLRAQRTYLLKQGASDSSTPPYYLTNLVGLSDSGAVVTNIALSAPIPVVSHYGTSNAIFSGYGRIAVWSGGRVYDVSLPAGTVVDRGYFYLPGRTPTESWATWGMVESISNRLWLSYAKNGTTIERARLPEAGEGTNVVTETVLTIASMNDMASFVASPSENAWYYFRESTDTYSTNMEAIVKLNASFLIGTAITPAVLTFTPAATLTNATSLAYTLTFAGTVTGLASGDFTVGGTATGWSVTNVSGSGSSYTVRLGGSGNTSGTVILTLNSNTVSSSSSTLGPYAATTAATVTIDRTAPTVSVFTPPATLTNATSLAYTLTFSENVTGLAAGDFTVNGTASGWSVTNITGSGASYTVRVGGASTSTGTVSLVLAANCVTDAIGNTGPTAAQTASTVTIDRTAPTATLTPPATLTKAASLAYTLTFSESISGLAAGDFTVNGTASGWSVTNITGSGASYTVRVGGASTSTGTVSLVLAANCVTDAIGNTGPVAAQTASTVTIDRTAPTVSVFTPPATLTNATSLAYTLTFSESVTGLAAGAFLSYAGTASGWSVTNVTGSGSSYTVFVGGGSTSTGTVTLGIYVNSVTDGAGNAGPTGNWAAPVTIDRTAPTVSAFTPPATLTNATSLVYTLTFSESVTGLAAGDFTVSGTASGWSVTNITGSGASYTVTVGGASTSTGTVILALNVSTVTDGAGNVGPASGLTASTVTIDRTAPTVSVFTPPATLTNATSLAYTLTFAESITGLATNDFYVGGTNTGWSVTNVTGSGASYTVFVGGASTSTGTVMLGLNPSIVTDGAGNVGPASGQWAATVTIDRTLPAVTALSRTVSTTCATTLSYTLTFSENVTGLAAGDFAVSGTATGWNVTNVTGSGSSYTVTLGGASTSAGTVILTLNASTVTDAIGNVGPASSQAASTVSIDRTAPTATLTPPATMTNATSLAYALTFSESVTGLATNDFNVGGTNTGWSVTNITGSGSAYTVFVGGGSTSAGTVILSLTAGTVTDGAGNNGPATSQTAATVTIDRTAPIALALTPSATLTNATSLAYALIVSENVTGLATTDFTVSGGSATGWSVTGVSGSGSNYTVTVGGGSTSAGTVILTLNASTVTDGAGNVGPASSRQASTVTIDRTAPTVSALTSPVTPTNATSLAYTLTFSKSVTGLATTDFTVSGGSATGWSVTNVTGSGSNYTVRVGGGSTSAGTVILKLNAITVTDAAGNAGPASIQTASTVTIDRTAPTVSAFTKPVSLTNAASLAYTLTFSRSVTGLATNDFSFGGTASGWSVTNITGSGSSYTVRAGGASTGTVVLTLNAGVVTDSVGNNGPATSATASTVTIDRTVATATLTPATTYTASTTNSYALAFSKSVTGLASGDFSVSGTASGWSVTGVSGSGASYTVQLGGAGVGTVVLTLGAGAVVDAAGNAAPAAGLAAATVTVARFAPTNTVLPAITNATFLSLRGTPGTWTGSPAPTFSYQWQVSTNFGVTWEKGAGSGVTTTNYTPANQERENLIRLQVTAANASGSTLAWSAPCRNVILAAFNYVGAIQTWTVPSGVTSIDVDLLGAGGGAASSAGVPGSGGRVQATLAVTPGQVLNLFVGQQGYSYAFPGNGSYNGGGAANATYAHAGGGGGATDIRINGTSLGHRMVVAGGGGGAGHNSTSEFGGSGGGLTGASGSDLQGSSSTAAGGGTQSAGGSGGSFSGYYSGGAGSLGQGGSLAYSQGGGGGGGGYYGGGAGAWGGGGGGSSYPTAANLTVTALAHTQGGNSGAGSAVISYTRDATIAEFAPLVRTNGSAITFRLRLAQASSGLGVDSFTVGGTASGWTVQSVSAASSSGYSDPYLITLAGGSTGTLILTLKTGELTLDGEAFPPAAVASATAQVIEAFEMTLGTTVSWITPDLQQAYTYKGDDRGGLALGSSVVMVTGDGSSIGIKNGSYRYNYQVIRDYLISDLKTRQAYMFCEGPYSANTPPYNLTSLTVLSDSGTPGAIIPLSMSLPVRSHTSVSNAMFSGYGRVVFYNGSRVYEIALPSGTVTDYGPFTLPARTSTESWATWGVAEYFDNHLWLSYGKDTYNIQRARVPNPGESAASVLETVLAIPGGMSDMASFVASPSENAWYYFREGGDWYSTTPEAILKLSASYRIGAASAPVVTTLAASLSGLNSAPQATLNGMVNPQGGTVDTAVSFVYGTNADLSGGTSVTVGQPLSGTTNVPVQFGTGALAPGTVYFFRAQASNSVGVTWGATKTFSTLPYVIGAADAGVWTFSTLAGLAGTSGTNNGTGTAARFNMPWGGTLDPDGNLYVCDKINHAVRKVTPGGVVTTIAGLPGTSGTANGIGTAARFNNPIGIARDSSGNLYVADSANNSIRKLTPSAGSTWTVTTFAGLPGTPGSADGAGTTARFCFPYGLAIDASNTLYVADAGNNTIRRVTPAGGVSTIGGVAGSLGSTDGSGTLARFSCPAAVAMGPAGSLYVSDGNNYTIRKMTPSGSAWVVSTIAGAAGTRGSTDGSGYAARFTAVYAIASDSSGTLYLSEFQSHTIRQMTSAGVVSTIGGLAGTSGAADGGGSVARFYGPMMAAAQNSSTIYVSDYNNKTIRKGVNNVAQSLTAFVGERVTIAVTAVGQNLNYQWRRNGTNIMGATSAVYTNSAVKLAEAGNYTCWVTTIGSASGVLGATTELTVLVAPSAVLTPATTLTCATSLGYTALFSTGVSGLTTNDFSVGGTAAGWRVTAVSGSGSNYTVTVSGSSTTAGSVLLTLASNVVTDASSIAGPRSAVSAASVTVDRTPPTAAFTSPAAPLSTNLTTLSGTLVFSKPVTGLTTNDFSVGGTAAGWRVTAVSGSGTNYTVTAGGTASGTLIISLNAGMVTDAAGNTGPAAVVTAATITIDRAAPTATLTAPGSATNATSLAFGLRFSRAVTGLASNDFSVGGSAGGWRVTGVSGSATNYTITLSGSALGSVQLTLNSLAGVDAVGNFGPTSSVVAASANVSASQTITFSTPAGQTYGNVPVSLSATASSGLPVGFALVSGPGSLSSNVLTLTGAGSMVVNAVQAGNASYAAAASVSRTITVQKKALAVTAQPASRAYGKANPPFSAALSGFVNGDTTGVVSGAAGASSTATPASPVGLYPITPSLGSLAATNYSFSSFVNGSLSVTAATATVTLTNLNLVYRGTNLGATAVTAPAGLGVTLQYTQNGTNVAPRNAGSYAVTAASSNSNYTGLATGTLTIAKASQVITFEPLPGAAPLNTLPNVDLQATSDSGLPVTMSLDAGSAAVLLGTTGVYRLTDIGQTGTVTLRANQGGNSNYTAAVEVVQTMDVTKMNQSIAFAALAPRTYGDASVALGATASSGLPVGFLVVSGPASLSGSNLTFTGAGDVLVRASQGGSDSYNTAPYVERAFTIAPAAQTITFDALADRTYGDAPVALNAASDRGLPVRYSVVSGPGVLSGSTLTIAGAGSLVLQASQSGSTNYSAATSVERTLAVARKALTATVQDAARAAGTPDPEFVVLYSGWAGSDTAAVLATAPTVASSAAADAPPGVYELTASGGADENYAFSYVPGTLTIAGVAPAIVTPPQGQTVNVGADVAFSVVASGTAPLACQWRLGAVALDGATNATLDLNDVLAGQAGDYRVVVTNAAGAVTSAVARLTVNRYSQTIAFDPPPAQQDGGEPAALAATASSGLPVSYASSDEGVAAVSGEAVIIVGPGSATITARQPGNETYLAATPVPQTFTVDAAPPVFLTQPEGQTQDVAQAATFTATLSGTLPIGLQWYRGTNALASATNATLALDNLATNMAGRYTLVASNVAGCATSGVAMLTVNRLAQTIAFDPLAGRMDTEAPFALAAVASSGLPVSYASANPDVATVSSNRVTIVGVGSTVITASQNGDDSYRPAEPVQQTLTVDYAVPVIITQPESQMVNAIGEVSMTVVAEGLAPLAYQWYLNDQPLPEATDATLTWLNALTNYAGNYTVVIVGAGGSATSAVATLTINPLPQSITMAELPVKMQTSEPFSPGATADSGLSVSYESADSAVATVVSNLVTMVGAGTTTITASQPGDGAYQAATPVSRTLTVMRDPDITTQPVDQQTIVGSNATFSVVAIGSAPLAYQWYFASNTLEAATNDTLALTGVTTNGAGAYFVVVSNVNGVVTSQTASLTVNYAPVAAAITLGNLSQAYDGSARSVTVTTDPTNLAFSVTYGGKPDVPVLAGAYAVIATVSDLRYSGETSNTLVIAKVTPGITAWPTASAITYGETLASAALVDGAATVEGRFAFIAPGAAPDAGAALQGVSFTPADATDYDSVTGSVSVTVNPAAATVTFGDLSQTYDGAAKAVSVTTDPGSLTVQVTYDGNAAAPTNAGRYAVTGMVSAANYSGQATNTLVVNKATPTVTLAVNNSPQTYDGAARSAGVSVVTSSVPGVVTNILTGGLASQTNVGVYAVTADFVAADTANCSNLLAQAAGDFVISQMIRPDVTAWPTAGALVYGQTLASSVLSNGAASVDGSFAFTTPAAAPDAGTALQGVTFTPADVMAYAPVTGSASVTVSQASATVTLGGLSQPYDGAAKAVNVTTDPAGLTVVVTYDGNAVAPTEIGNYTVIGVIVEANYCGSATNILAIGRALCVLEIQSPHGLGTPATGFYTNSAESVLTNRMASPEPAGGTQYVCAGWSMVGNEPASGVTTQCVMTATNSAVLTWLWATNYYLEVNAGPHGSVDQETGWRAGLSNVTLTATPDHHFHLASWSGNASGASTPLELLMDAPKSVTASFAANYTEAHPTPEAWLAQYGITSEFEKNSLDDADCDGLANWQEYIAGTDPTNRSSGLVVSQIDPLWGSEGKVAGHIVTWSGVTGRVYDVEYSTNLVDWLNLDGAADLPGRSPVTTFTDLAPVGFKFYRVQVRLP